MLLMKKISTILVLVMISLTIIVSMNAEAQVKNKSFQFTLQLMLSNKTPVIEITEAAKQQSIYTFIDAREPAEYAVSHIQHARFAGYSVYKPEVLADLPKNAPLIVYCSVGKRSEDVTNKLLDNGFTNVRNLYGGIFEWINEGYKVYDSTGKAVNQVHAFNKVWGQWVHAPDLKKVYN